MSKLPNQIGLKLLRPVARSWAQRRYEISVYGLAEVPAKPVIYAANHLSALDGPFLAAFAPQPVHALTKIEMFRGASSWVMRAVGQFPVDREHVDPSAIKTALGLLAANRSVGIFPEGSRGDGAVTHSLGGAAYLGLCSGAPIVPVVFLGTRPTGGGLNAIPARGARILIDFGPAIYPEPQPWPRRSAEIEALNLKLRLRLQERINFWTRTTELQLPGEIADN